MKWLKLNAKQLINQLNHVNSQSNYAINYAEIKGFNRPLGLMVQTNLSIQLDLSTRSNN